MIYDDLVPESRYKLYNWISVISILNAMFHMFGWSLFSLDQFRFLSGLPHVQEAIRMDASEYTADYAAAYAEFMAIQFPLVLISTILIPCIIIRRFLKMFGFFKNSKTESRVLLAVWWIPYVIAYPFFLSSSPSFSAIEFAAPLGAGEFFAFCVCMTFCTAYPVVVSVEAFFNPHSEMFIRLSKIRELEGHPVHSKYRIRSDESRRLREKNQDNIKEG